MEDLINAGVFPSEEATEEEVTEKQHLLERISQPVSNEEAHALAKVFGTDDCFGLSWTLLHLIETAPDAQSAHYSVGEANVWVDLLNSRVAHGKKLAERQGRTDNSR
ncbi:hypothetical protein ACIRQP_42210 [Streptomyces sp. NPDC102274]|uniref:hypothetical protein n=1 Tax=Streptomyces sp. NPDC102274 TaxID=3366151 RepID=UPI0037FD4266